MKFFSVTFVVALFCAVAVSAAPSPFAREFSLIDESTFGLTDTVTKLLNSMIEKTKCTLDVMEHVLEGTELETVYKKFRTDVETIIKVNVTECLNTKGVAKKLKCALDVQLKINSLNYNLVKQILKTNKDLAVKITKALYQCAKKPAPFISNEEFSDEVTFGATDSVTKLLNALIEKTKCILDVLEDLLKGTELESLYKKLRAEVKSILDNNVKQCGQIEGAVGKLNCFLSVTQKLNTIFADFINEATKTSKDLAVKIYNAVVQCAKKPAPFISADEFAISSDSVADKLNKFIEQIKCSLDVLDDMLKGTELETVYKKLRAEVSSIVDNDLKQCQQIDGSIKKLNKDLATKIYNAVVQCVKKPAAFISNDKFAITSFDDEMTYGLTDTVGKLYDALIKKTKCALDAIEKIVGEGELGHLYKELRSEVESILENDVKQCANANGLIGKVKCVLTLTQKINTLYAKFVNEAMKTNKDVATNIVKALTQCLKSSKPEEPKPEEPETPTDAISLFGNEMTYGASDSVDEKLNKFIEQIKCSLDVLDDMLKGTELETVYKKLRAEVSSIVDNDLKQCQQIDGSIKKLNCLLTATQKLNTIFVNFVNEASKTSKDLATKIYNAVIQCAKN